MKRRLYTTYALIALLLLFSACSKNSDVVTANDVKEQQQPAPIVFDSYLQNSQKATRATYPADKEGTIGIEQLRTAGFGVFSQYTENTAWSSYTKTNAFNFMWNQQVDWNSSLTNWTYTPVKYWPNDNNPADDNGATGSQTHSYLSFFAYAPYVQVADPATGFDVKDTDGNSDGKPDHDGIVQIVNNSTDIENSYIYYRTNNDEPFDADESVDLLWAVPQMDLHKTKATGEGYTTGTVNLAFKHALSLFTITVQGLFDHANNDDTSITYPDDRDMYSHILIESVDFTDPPLFKEGTMYIAPNPVDATVPRWDINSGTRQSIAISGLDINSTLTNSYLEGTVKKYWDDDTPANGMLKDTDMDEDGDVDAADALALYNQLPKGVSHEEVPLYYQSDYYYMVLPNKEYRDANPSDKMKVHIVYYVITYDERLTLVKTGCPKYFSIVKNDITATFDAFSFEPNKKYKLRLQPGLTSAKFEVTMVDGWDTPMTLDPEVVDWYSTPIEYNVE